MPQNLLFADREDKILDKIIVKSFTAGNAGTFMTNAALIIWNISWKKYTKELYEFWY